MSAREYLSIREFSLATGVPRTTVAGWCQRGVVRCRRIGRRVLIYADELERDRGSEAQEVNDGNVGGEALEARRFLASMGGRT